MKVLFRLHGELLMGNRGSAVVELAASWAIIMIVTGLFLWWPRKARTLGGIVYPRLRGGSRMFWRDLHGVTGFWISGLALFLLFSGLPWAKFWGDYFRNMRRLPARPWRSRTGRTGKPRRPASEIGEARPVSTTNIARNRRWRRGRGATPSDLTAVDRIVATLRPLDLLPPVVIEPPARGSGDWTAKSMTPNRPRRVDLVVDGATGAIKDRTDFKDRHLDRQDRRDWHRRSRRATLRLAQPAPGARHCHGLDPALSVSSVVMWWRRREPGSPGCARIPRRALASRSGLVILVALFGIYLPLFGASLIAVLVLEWTLLRRIPRIRDWLGLEPPVAQSVTSEAFG